MGDEKKVKDYWDKSDILLKHVVAGLIPLALFMLGNSVRDADRAAGRAQAVATVVSKATDAKTEDQLELVWSPLASYGKEAVPPLEAMIRSQYFLWGNPPNLDQTDSATRKRRIQFLSMQMSYLDKAGAEAFVRLVEALDIGVSHNRNPVTHGVWPCDNSIADPVVSSFDAMAQSNPEVAMPVLVNALGSRINEKKDTYAVVLGNRYSTRWDSEVLNALLDNAFDPHGGQDNQPLWCVDCVYASGKVVSEMLTKPEWVRGRLTAMKKLPNAPTEALDFALSQFVKHVGC